MKLEIKNTKKLHYKDIKEKLLKTVSSLAYLVKIVYLIRCNFLKHIIHMKLTNLDLPTLQNVRTHWVSSASTQPNVSEESLELIEQFFDLIEQNHLYGDFQERPNSSTHIGVDLDEDGVIDVIAEVIYFRRGRVKTFKIMDIYYSPAIEALEVSAYDNKCIHTLAYIVNQFVQESSDAVGGSTKIYARTNTSLKYLTQLHEAIESMKEDFEAVGLEVNKEGERWLAFRVKK